MSASLCLLVHGDSGVGKSWLADTAPGPRLILDAEGGTKWTKSNKIKWDPRIAPPAGLGPDDSVVVRVLSFKDMELCLQWLQSGQHEFNSVVVDSITELQAKCMDAIAGVNAPQTQDWGTLLRKMQAVATGMRDLPDHPTRPVNHIVFVAGSQAKENKIRPHLQGQLQLKLPYIVDVLGYLFTTTDAAGGIQRGMMIQPMPGYDAKDRTDVLSRHFGTTIPDPTIPTMMEVLNAV